MEITTRKSGVAKRIGCIGCSSFGIGLFVPFWFVFYSLSNRDPFFVAIVIWSTILISPVAIASLIFFLNKFKLKEWKIVAYTILFVNILAFVLVVGLLLKGYIDLRNEG